jgi:hypothetical protein
MDERNDGMAKKPFYENIVSKKKRTEGRRSGSGDRKASAGKSADKGRSSGSARDGRDARDARPRDGDAAASGARPGAPRDGRSFRGERRDDRTSRDDRAGQRDRGVRHDHSERHDRDARTDRPGRDERRPRDDRESCGDRGAYSRDGARAHDGVRTRDGAHAGASSDRAYRGDRPVRDGAAPNAHAYAAAPRQRRPFAAPKERDPVFKKILPDTRALLEAFPEIVQSVMPLDSKRLQELPSEIRELSHGLTDERGDRRVGYMNDPAVISAYVRYYMWWNLVRLTRVFSGLPLTLHDGDAAVDLGSGPLTLPIALWMARPDLRAVKLTWYCVDLSQNALSAGEELFLSLAARTGCEPWQIVRIKGECGVPLRRRVAFVASANMFNELFWDNPAPIEQQAKHHAQDLASYADRASSIFLVEPGIPRAGRFISLMRDAFIRAGFSIQSPCPHEGVCPFPGLRNGKWCHFVFDTSDAPAKLHKLSDDAGLAKDRAALSFVFASRTEEMKADAGNAQDAATGLSVGDTQLAANEPDAGNNLSVADASIAGENGSAEQAAPVAPAIPEAPAEAPLSMLSRMSSLFPDLSVRITSDPIRLPEYHTGRYGCSELGMVLLMGTYQAADYLMGCHSGSLVEVPMPDRKRPERDGKTGAIIIRLK